MTLLTLHPPLKETDHVGLDYWAGLMDWITGLTLELNLFASPDLQPIRRVERTHDFISKYNGLLSAMVALLLSVLCTSFSTLN